MSAFLTVADGSETQGHAPVLLDSKLADNDVFLDLANTSGVDYGRYLLVHANVVSDVESDPAGPQNGALLTAYCSVDGVTFDEGPYYYNDGVSNFGGEANPSYLPPTHIGPPQTLSMGCRLSIDTGDWASYGATGYAIFFAAGNHNGEPVNTQYMAFSDKGAIGGQAGISPKPAHLGGGAWFDQDPYGTSFYWSCGVAYHGNYSGATGQKLKALRLRVDRTSVPTAKIRSGHVALYGLP